MELAQLWAAYEAAADAMDQDGAAACVLEAKRMAIANPALEKEPEMRAFEDGRLIHVFAAAMTALERHEDALAAYYWRELPRDFIVRSAWLPEVDYYWGLIHYRQGEYAQAKQQFVQHIERFPNHAEAWFMAGNAAAHLGERIAAIKAYRQALYLRQDFPEARSNLQKIVQGMQAAAGTPLPALMEEPDARLLFRPDDWEAVRRIPIFINCRDRLGCLEKLVDWLLAAGYTNVILLDNDSTYPPLLDFYERIRSERVRVVFLGSNCGHCALWDTNILELLQVQGPYVYTDPDVVPDAACPPDFLQEDARILAEHPLFEKVGAGLIYSDITYFRRRETMKAESRFYRAAIEPDAYYANVDTTFALYRGARHYHRAPAIRMGGRYAFRHLPWYYAEGEPLPEDEQYYLDHASYASSLKYTMDQHNEHK